MWDLQKKKIGPFIPAFWIEFFDMSYIYVYFQWECRGPISSTCKGIIIEIIHRLLELERISLKAPIFPLKNRCFEWDNDKIMHCAIITDHVRIERDYRTVHLNDLSSGYRERKRVDVGRLQTSWHRQGILARSGTYSGM